MIPYLMGPDQKEINTLIKNWKYYKFEDQGNLSDCLGMKIENTRMEVWNGHSQH
jgi:hypothetical protein